MPFATYQFPTSHFSLPTKCVRISVPFFSLLCDFFATQNDITRRSSLIKNSLYLFPFCSYLFTSIFLSFIKNGFNFQLAWASPDIFSGRARKICLLILIKLAVFWAIQDNPGATLSEGPPGGLVPPPLKKI